MPSITYTEAEIKQFKEDHGTFNNVSAKISSNALAITSATISFTFVSNRTCTVKAIRVLILPQDLSTGITYADITGSWDLEAGKTFTMHTTTLSFVKDPLAFLKTIQYISIGAHNYTGSNTPPTSNFTSLTLTFNYTAPTMTYSGSTLSLSQSGYTITATKGGSAASVNDGSTVTYYLYEGSTQKATFSGNTATVTLNSSTFSAHTYKIVAKSSSGLSADGASASITPKHTLTWSSSKSLTFSQSGYTITATKSGTATDNCGSTVTYYLYEGSTQKAAFSGNTATVTIDANTFTQHTYKVVAKSTSPTTLTADGPSATFTPTHTLTWSSSKSLTFSQSGYTITATKSGTATDNCGSTVTYYLYEGSTQKATFSGNTATVTIDANTFTQHTYKVVAKSTSPTTLTTDGPSATFTPTHTLTWSNSPSLTFSQSGYTITVTKSGTATDNCGSAVTYYLYEGSTQKATFSGNTATVTIDANTFTQHTYKVVAKSTSPTTVTTDGPSATFTPVHTITWPASSKLSIKQGGYSEWKYGGGMLVSGDSGYNISVGIDSTSYFPTDNCGSEIKYYLYEGSTQIGECVEGVTFGDDGPKVTGIYAPVIVLNKDTFTTHTYKIVAKSTSPTAVAADSPSVSITPVHTLVWSEENALTLSQYADNVTATMSGYAIDNCEKTGIAYYLYEGSTKVATFNLEDGSTTASVTFVETNLGAHTYKVIAESTSPTTLTADGPSASITLAHTLTWSSAASLTFSQSGYTITVTKSGIATDNYGSTVTYYLYEGSTQKATFSGNTATVTIDANTFTQHTYKVVAKSTSPTTVTADGPSATFTPVHEITWPSSFTTLNVKQEGLGLGSDEHSTYGASGYNITATLKSSELATDNLGSEITYYLYEGSTQVAEFGSDNPNGLTFTGNLYAAVTLTDDTFTGHTYKVVAKSTSPTEVTADGPSGTVTPVHTITWSSNSALTLTQNGLKITAKRTGYARDNCKISTAYYLYEGSTKLARFNLSNNTATTITLNVDNFTQHTYTIVAESTSPTEVSEPGPSATINPVHTLEKDTSISGTYYIVQQEEKLVVIVSGRAKDNLGLPVKHYYLYDGENIIGEFDFDTSNRLEYVIPDTDFDATHTYKVIAVSQSSSTLPEVTCELYSTNLYLEAPHKTVKYYTNGEFIECIPYYYDGTNFVEVEAYYYNGTNWVLCSAR